MKKKITSILLLGFMAISLLACGSNNTSSGNKMQVTLGTTAWPTNMLFYLAKEEGIFEKNGLDVTIQNFSSTTDSSNAFVGGKLDFCTYASSETIAPFSQGGKINNILVTDKSNGCEGLVSTSNIKTVKDLKGKTIATQKYSVDHMFLLTLLSDAGLSEKDVNIVDMSIQQSGNAFIQGKCDAACVWDPYFSNAIKSGGNKLYSSADDPDLITDCLAASDNMVKDNPKAVKAMIKSWYQTIEYWNKNPDKANEVMAKELGVSKKEFEEEMKGLYIPNADEVVEAFTEADDYKYWAYTQNKVEDFMSNLGIIDKKVDCKNMIQDKFIKDYVKNK